jgi:hypothetical protein
MSAHEDPSVTGAAAPREVCVQNETPSKLVVPNQRFAIAVRAVN